MARMLPQRLRLETKSDAERRLYHALQRSLPDDFVVFHSVRWLAQDPQSGPREGETDFIIAHPTLGILVLEVKGGCIRYDGALAQWYSNDIPIKDPVLQARESKHSLLGKLKGLPEWRDRWITVGYAVAFHDVEVNRDLLPDLPEPLVLDTPAMTDLPAWVRRALEYWHAHDRQAGAIGERGMRLLQDILSPSWELRPSLRFAVQREEEEIRRLTEEQFHILDLLQGQRRALIVGCAGSGKTTLALEQARRLGSQGFRVLFTCFNRLLADRLQQVGLPETVDVQNFHRLVPAWADQAGLREERERRAGEVDEETLYTHVFPEILCRAAEILGPRYDALIVDEGQDFEEKWFLALAFLLRNPDTAIIYVFKDDNQNLFRPCFALPWEMPEYPLTRNCRNTRHIHRKAVRFYRSERVPQAIGPEGSPPEVYFYKDSDDLHGHLRRLIHQFIAEEGLSNQDLVVLLGHRNLLQRGKLGNFSLTDRWPPTRKGEIPCITVHAFKGLESPVVILAGLDEEVYPDFTTAAYVGMSRARTRLVILAPETLPDALRRALEG